ncbi:helix-turn-helix transcriptional regulator [Asaia siamensis]
MSIVHLLDRANIRQNQVASLIGVSQATVSQWFSGKRRIPSDKLRPVARLLGASLDELVPEETSFEGGRPGGPATASQTNSPTLNTDTALLIVPDEILQAGAKFNFRHKAAERYEP